jgi:hypothetical protein
LPTPVTHLVIAQHILDARPELMPKGDSSALAAFLLGSTLADVRVLTGEPRTATHFLRLPPRRGESGIRAMLHEYPSLANLNGAGLCARLMVAGYLAHLLADEIWLARVYWPYFRSPQVHHDPDRLLRHDLLRSVMDQQDRAAVRRAFRGALESARCGHPFPFISEASAESWRQLVVRELESPDSSPTFAHFASRYGLSLDEFVAMLRSPERMAEVLNSVPAGTFSRYHEETARLGGELAALYMAGEVERFPLPLLDPENPEPYIV